MEEDNEEDAKNDNLAAFTSFQTCLLGCKITRPGK